MSDADWNTVTVLRKKPPKPSAMKTEQAVNAARRQGLAVDTQQKWGAAQNKHHQTTMNTARLDQETEELKHQRVPPSLGKLIQQGRQAKGWTQKELANRINEKQQVVTDYESGKAIPNQVILGKIERALGTKLRGKEKVCETPQQPPGKAKK